jgi:hypothetical protein
MVYILFKVSYVCSLLKTSTATFDRTLAQQWRAEIHQLGQIASTLATIYKLTSGVKCPTDAFTGTACALLLNGILPVLLAASVVANVVRRALLLVLGSKSLSLCLSNSVAHYRDLLALVNPSG